MADNKATPLKPTRHVTMKELYKLFRSKALGSASELSIWPFQFSRFYHSENLHPIPVYKRTDEEAHAPPAHTKQGRGDRIFEKGGYR